MAPPRSRPQPEDQKSETSSIKVKPGSTTSNAINGKARRDASNTAGSSLRDVVTAGASVSEGETAESGPGIHWSSFDLETLEAYRYDYCLDTPPAFINTYNQLVLSRPGIGRMSPTMARRKEQRKQSKEQLANAVRKHFNDMGINENEVVVDFLYKVRWQDKNFRMRFMPQRPR